MFYALALIAGYLLSIFTWPWLRLKINGIEYEIDGFRDKARALEKKVLDLEPKL